MKVNQTLTNFAAGVAIDLNKSDAPLQFASFLCPEVVVGGAVGQFKTYSTREAFQVVETARPIGGGAKRLEFSEGDGFFNCKPQALEITIDQHERDQAGEGDLLGLQRSKISTLVTATALSYASKVIAMAKTVTAVAGAGVWIGTQTEDPVDTLDGLIEDMATKTNRMPDRLAISLSVWRKLRSHPKVLARFQGLAPAVSEEQFVGLLLHSQIKLKIGSFGYDAKKPGTAAKDMKNMLGNDVFMFHASDTPTQYDPSFMKCFRTRRGGVNSVREYKSNDERQDVYAVDWTQDLQIIGTECVRRLAIT